jgi:hypothetical protein
MAFSNSVVVGVSIGQRERPRGHQPFTWLLSNDADWFLFMPASEPVFQDRFV